MTTTKFRMGVEAIGERLKFLEVKAYESGLAPWEIKQRDAAKEILEHADQALVLEEKGLTGVLQPGELKTIRDIEESIEAFARINPYLGATTKIHYFRIYIEQHGGPVNATKMCKELQDQHRKWKSWRYLYNGLKTAMRLKKTTSALVGYWDDAIGNWIVGLPEWGIDNPIWGKGFGRNVGWGGPDVWFAE